LYETDPEKQPDYRKFWPNYSFPGGDNICEYFVRAGKTLMGYLQDDYPGTTLLTSHAGFIGAAVGALTHGEPARLFEVEMRPCNCLEVQLVDGKVVYRYI
ncbi:MAG: histidine phosphatase family protein, partial [Christensenellaceae bacterium]|nr:histidine phosphatase family protein [Christensenellaceae bacterium]